MEKELLIGGRRCRLKSSAAIPRIYRQLFNSDLLVEIDEIYQYSSSRKRLNKELEAKAASEGMEFEPVSENLLPEHITTLENLMYVMNKYGDPEQPDDIKSWLDQFDVFDVYNALPEVLKMWNEERKQTSRAKKKSDQ